MSAHRILGLKQGPKGMGCSAILKAVRELGFRNVVRTVRGPICRWA